jgi:hypothetical protein
MRGGGSRTKVSEEIVANEKTNSQAAAEPSDSSTSDSVASPETRRVLRKLKSELEDLLTRLNADASIKR